MCPESNAPSPDGSTSQACKLLSDIVQAIVSQPQSVWIHSKTEGHRVNFYVKVAADDQGKLIGKQGRTAKSIRVILAGVAMKHRRTYNLELMDGSPVDPAVRD
jgi:uncharacterized protein